VGKAQAIEAERHILRSRPGVALPQTSLSAPLPEIFQCGCGVLVLFRVGGGWWGVIENNIGSVLFGRQPAFD